MEKKTIEISWVKSFSENKGAQGTLSVAQVFADDDIGADLQRPLVMTIISNIYVGLQCSWKEFIRLWVFSMGIMEKSFMANWHSP